MGMKIGERAKLTCPPDFAYGARWVATTLQLWGAACLHWHGIPARLTSGTRQQQLA